MWGLPSLCMSTVVLRLARLLVSSPKLAHRRRNRHVRRRQHGAQLADLAPHRARLHRRQRGANEHPRQFDRLLLQDKLERGVRRGGPRSELLRSRFRGCWRRRVRHLRHDTRGNQRCQNQTNFYFHKITRTFINYFVVKPDVTHLYNFIVFFSPFHWLHIRILIFYIILSLLAFCG